MKAIIRYLLILSITFSSCKYNSIAARLYSKCDGQNKCILLVKDATTFKWDRVYIFSIGASLEDIEKTIGVPYNLWQDVGERIIFTEKGKVVYHEEYFPYPEHIEKGITSFQLSKAPYVGQYSTAAFSVTKQKNHKGELYYVVIPIQ